MHCKAALCFIINYEHVLHKEPLWRNWIEPNKDILNVYFFYEDYNKIRSNWIRTHCIPPQYIVPTTYYQVVPAYMRILQFASLFEENQWFCLLTDTCCPIVSPYVFRQRFIENMDKSIIRCKPAWWNPDYTKRANLHKIPRDLWLANDPWFILTREHVLFIIHGLKSHSSVAATICAGGLANESIFAIFLYLGGFWRPSAPNLSIINACSHITDWTQPASATSPHIFKEGTADEILMIEDGLKTECNALFIRKVHSTFPEEILKKYIEPTKEDILSIPIQLKPLITTLLLLFRRVP